MPNYNQYSAAAASTGYQAPQTNVYVQPSGYGVPQAGGGPQMETPYYNAQPMPMPPFDTQSDTSAKRKGKIHKPGFGS
jgi:hypothetical protein